MVERSFNHLLPEIRPLLELSVAERILYIERDNWIGYPRAKLALKRLHDLYCYPPCQRMPNLLIIGPTNQGKSMIIEKFCRNYPPIKKKTKRLYGYKEILIEMPVLSVQMLPVPDTRRFYRAIFDQLRLADGIEDKLFRALPTEGDFIDVLKHLKVKMLVIDEIHNILAGRNDKQHEFLNALRFLGNSLRIPIVGVGTKDAYLAIRSDAQLENRFEPFMLPLWKSGSDYDSLLASIVTVLPLKEYSPLNHPFLSNTILEKSEGVLGEIFMLLRRAAVMALESGNEKIDRSILNKMDYHSPTERIQLFERHVTGML